MPATNGVTARLTNMQSVRVEKEKKIQPLSHPASYHKGTFNKPHEKEQVILCNDFIKCPHHTWR